MSDKEELMEAWMADQLQYKCSPTAVWVHPKYVVHAMYQMGWLTPERATPTGIGFSCQ